MDWLLGKKKPDEPEDGAAAGGTDAIPAEGVPIGATGAGTGDADESGAFSEISKGAYLAVVVLVTGKDAPAHPFVPDAEQVVREVLASGRSTLHPDWQIAVEKISETEMPGEWD